MQGQPVSEGPRGHGWWQAADLRWYAPEQHPDYRPVALPPPPHQNQPMSPNPMSPNPMSPNPMAFQPPIGDDAGMRMLLPVGRSGWAIAAGYLGLIAWVIFPLGPFAIIAAELGRREISRDPHRHGIGRCTLGYVGGGIGIIIGIVWVIALLTAA